jgi:hypothetical protein
LKFKLPTISFCQVQEETMKTSDLGSFLAQTSEASKLRGDRNRNHHEIIGEGVAGMSHTMPAKSDRVRSFLWQSRDP